jgi:hypothetical protein
LPTTPEFQEVLCTVPPPLQTAHRKDAMQHPGVLAEPLPRRPQFRGDLHAVPPPHRNGTMRPRHATTPLTARRKVIIKSGKRKKRPVVRYSAVPWHGIAAMRNVPQHRGKAGVAGCRPAIPDYNATDRGRHVYDPCTNRGRSVTEQSNALLTLGALVFALAKRYPPITESVRAQNPGIRPRLFPDAVRMRCEQTTDGMRIGSFG